jgi:hypothetical protein
MKKKVLYNMATCSASIILGFVSHVVLSPKNKKDYKIQRDLKKLYLILLYLVFISFSWRFN